MNKIHTPNWSIEKASDSQIQSWALRHGLNGFSPNDLRCAYENARTEEIWAKMVDAPARCRMCGAIVVSPTIGKTLNRCHCGGELVSEKAFDSSKYDIDNMPD